MQLGLNTHAIQGVMDSSGHAAQIGSLLDQINFKALCGHVQGAGHACQATADHQGDLVDRQFKLLQGLQMRGARYRHADDILGLLGGILLVFRMHPGTVLADIGKLEEILIDARFPAGIAEQRLMGARRTGRQHHAVEPFVFDLIGDLLGIFGRAGEQIFPRPGNILQGCSIFDYLWNIHHPADIGAAVAHHHPDLELLL